MIVGITGSIGSGKSTVCHILKKSGYPVLSADEIAKQLMEPGNAGYQAVVKTFPAAILNQDGSVDRHRLANLIFQNQNYKSMLEAILHPLVKDEMFHQSIAYELVFWEVPLLFETDFHKYCDKTLCVISEEATLIQRVMQRSGLTNRQVEERLQAQMSQQQKQEMADYIIKNNGTMEELQEAVDAWLKLLLMQEKREDGHVVSRK